MVVGSRLRRGSTWRALSQNDLIDRDVIRRAASYIDLASRTKALILTRSQIATMSG